MKKFWGIYWNDKNWGKMQVFADSFEEAQEKVVTKMNDYGFKGCMITPMEVRDE